MIRRLRELPSAHDLMKMYATPHDHQIYGYGHWLRVEHTIVMAKWMKADYHLVSVADLSCGNGEIVNQSGPWPGKHLGDFAPGYEYTGPMADTIKMIPNVDLFVCSETIEHVDDPRGTLEQIRSVSKYLLLSTPITDGIDTNPEHLWSWDQEGMGDLLGRSGWTSVAQVDLLLPDTYSYQVWACE